MFRFALIGVYIAALLFAPLQGAYAASYAFHKKPTVKKQWQLKKPPTQVRYWKPHTHTRIQDPLNGGPAFTLRWLSSGDPRRAPTQEVRHRGEFVPIQSIQMVVRCYDDQDERIVHQGSALHDPAKHEILMDIGIPAAAVSCTANVQGLCAAPNHPAGLIPCWQAVIFDSSGNGGDAYGYFHTYSEAQNRWTERFPEVRIVEQFRYPAWYF